MRRSTLILVGLPAMLMFTSCSDDSASDTESSANATLASEPATVATTIPPATSPPTTAPTATAPDTSVATTIDSGPPVLVQPGVLEPGKYIGNMIDQPLTFELVIPWRAFENVEALALLAERKPEDTSDPDGEVGIDVSTDLVYTDAVAATQALDGVEFGEPVPTSLGGLDGVKLEAPVIPEQVVVPFMFNDQLGEPWVLFQGTRHEVYVLDRPGDTALIVWIDSPEAEWASFRSDVEALLGTIEFQE